MRAGLAPAHMLERIDLRQKYPAQRSPGDSRVTVEQECRH